MKLWLKKILCNTGRNVTTLILLPDFLLFFLFASYILIFWRHGSHPRFHPWQGKDHIAVAPTLPHLPQKGKYFCSEERKYRENSCSGVVRQSSSDPGPNLAFPHAAAHLVSARTPCRSPACRRAPSREHHWCCCDIETFTRWKMLVALFPSKRSL